jgi:ABC-type polysaccharide/polyol phosphate transport system ATPase subunit
VPSTPAVEARGLSKRFVLRHNSALSLKVRLLGLLQPRQREIREEFWALRDISVAIGQGESVALVGRNGSGKSTFLKLVAGIHRPTVGQLLLRRGARVGSMIELGIGFHPDLSGTENVFLNAAIHGLTRAQIEAIYPAVVEYSGLAHFMDVPIKNYSSGMNMRLGFAIAANLEADVLLLDEIFAVGDEDFQKQCMKTMEQFAEEGRTLIFVSHAPSAVREICRRVCVLDHGRLLFDGGVEEGLAEYHRLIEGSPASGAEAPPADLTPPLESAPGPRTWEQVSDEWAQAFLVREGLRHDRRVLQITCSAPGSTSLAAYVGAERYQQWDVSVVLDRPMLPFDYAIASPLITRISLNAIVRCLMIVMRVMEPGARLYAAWIDDDDPGSVEDIPPFRYPFGILAGVAAGLGLRATRVADPAHPAGESVVLFERA